jgi:HK97 family phage major capsid protein
MAPKIEIPTDADGLQAFLTDPAKIKAMMGEPGAFKSFITAYAKNVVAKDTGMKDQIQEQVQLGIAEFMKDNGFGGKGPKVDLTSTGAPRMRGFTNQDPNAFPGGNYQAQKQCLYNKTAVGAQLDGQMDSLANLFRGIASAQRGQRFRDTPDLLAQLEKIQDIQNSFSTNVPSDGGFLLPEEFRSDLLMVALEHAIMRPRATVIPMSSQTLAIPAVDDTTHAGGTVFGGVQVFWVDESTQPAESSGKFAQVKLDAKKLMAYMTAPQELVADAPAFNAYMNQVLPQALAFEEDYRFIQGSGAGQPLGFLNGGGVVSATAVTGQGSGTLIVDNLAAMFTRLLPSSLMNAIWIADIGTFQQLALMAVQGSLGNSTPVWMNNGVIGAPPMAIYGRPLYFTEKCPALGNAGDITLIDPSFYLIGDRQAVTASSSEHFAFGTDKIAYKIIERVDGRPWLQQPITPRNGGATLSAYVNLSGTRT